MNYVDDYVARLNAIKQVQLSGMQLGSPASKADIANFILQRARSDFSIEAPSITPPKKTGLLHKAKSIGQGILDVLSRPLYATAESVDEIFNEDAGQSLKAALSGAGIKGGWEGLSGKEKTSFIDVIQHADERHIKDSNEYKAISDPARQQEYLQEKMKQKRTSAFIYGLAGDLVLDPLNLVGVGEVKSAVTAPKKVIDAIKGVKTGEKLDEAEQAGEAVAAVSKASPEPGQVSATPQPVQKPVETISPETGQAISEARHANLGDVFNRDIRPQDYAKLTKARVIHETAQIVDQVGKHNPSAIDFLTYKNLLPLPPVARAEVIRAVDKVAKKIRDPKIATQNYNAAAQSEMSRHLLSAARQQVAKSAGMYAASPESFTPAIYNQYLHMLKNAEESMIEIPGDNFKPRGALRPGSPYLRLSDVLEALPLEVAHKIILGDMKERVSPSILMRAVTGDKAALGQLSKKPIQTSSGSTNIANEVAKIDWTPMMVKDYATRIIEGANKTQQSTDEAAKFISQAMASESSDVAKEAAADAVVKFAKNEFKNEMPEVKKTFGETLDGLRKAIVHPVPSMADIAINNNDKLKLANDVFKSGTEGQAARIKTSTAVTNDVLQTELGAGVTVKEAATDYTAASLAAERGIPATVLSWVKPNFGYKELRPILLENVGVRRASATTRAHDIINIFSKIPEKEHLDFWHEVRGHTTQIPSGHQESVDKMRKMMANMFGESGLSEKFAGNTSISRSGTNVEHLNKHLRIVGVKGWKFTTKTKDPFTGKQLELEPNQILNTWRDYHPKDSADLRVFAFNLTQAVENAMVEYSAFSQLGAIWGSRKAGEGLVQVSGMHPAIEGMYFPKEIAPQIGKMATGIDQFTEALASSKFLKTYDHLLRTWKSGVTIYSPSHHIRNLIGDGFLAWMDGVNNPVYFTKAGQILVSKHNFYSDIDPNKVPLGQLLRSDRKENILKEIQGQATRQIPKGSRKIATARIGGKAHPVTIDQVYEMAFRHGILPHSGVIEDLPGTETLFENLANRYHPGKLGPFAPAKGQVSKKIKKLSESREHYVRIAHFLHAIEHPKNKPGSLDELFRDAADRVRKFHPDGLDLTQVEKRVFRRLIPFYSWNRKAIPLIVEGLFTNPHKIMAYPKLTSGLQEMQGIESSPSEQWPTDQLFPDWLNGNVIGPVLKPDNPFAKAIARSDDETGYTLVNPGLPSTDIMEDFFNNPLKGIGNSVTPAIKVPAELAFNKEFLTGAPIDDYTEYADKNIPILANASRMSQGLIGTGLLEGGDLRGKETQPVNYPAIINFLTAAGILDTGRYIKGGEFDLKERLKNANK